MSRLSLLFSKAWNILQIWLKSRLDRVLTVKRNSPVWSDSVTPQSDLGSEQKQANILGVLRFKPSKTPSGCRPSAPDRQPDSEVGNRQPEHQWQPRQERWLQGVGSGEKTVVRKISYRFIPLNKDRLSSLTKPKRSHRRDQTLRGVGASRAASIAWRHANDRLGSRISRR